MKQLTEEMFIRIVKTNETSEQDYQALLPYLKDVEEERYIPKVYAVIDTSNNRILGCFESSEDAYKYADSRVAVQLLIVEPSKQRTKRVDETPKCETVEEHNERLSRDIKMVTAPIEQNYFMHQHYPSRLEIAKDFMRTLMTVPGSAGYEWAAHEALRYADELIKQSKQQP